MSDRNEANDDLSEILAPRPGQSPSALREKLLRQTEARVVRQRWLRRSTRVAAVAAVFLLGGLTGWLVRPEPVSVPGPSSEPEIVFVPVPVVVPASMPAENGSSGPPEIARQRSASETEMQAEQEDDLTAAARLYKLAGDAFLREENYSNATRCYRLYLVRAGDAALSLNPDDSWLLTSLKNAAFQEKKYVSKTSR